jgi:uncharacterized protein (TIGR02594 family)
MTDTPWMEIARAEIGVTETPGPGTTLRIREYHAETTLHAKDDETAWCSAFVNWVMKQCGIEGTRQASARSWLTWAGGERCEAKPGAIAVLWRGKPVGWQGHVAFIDRIEDDTLCLLGGNQDNAVGIAAYPKARLLGCRWPKAAGSDKQ